MMPELGSFAIILALCFTLIQAFTPIWAHYKNNPAYLYLSKIAIWGQFSFLAFAMLDLMICFFQNDMTVQYVQDHSHTLLPLIYRIGAAWSGHEGSLLLWCLILAGWTCVFRIFYRGNIKLGDNVIMVLGFLNAGFILFLFATSNPFLRNFPINPTMGADLTPVLQDPGLIFHPPMLYLGYVGFSIGFAFAISALLMGKIDENWARTCRPWIILPWSFLSVGIVLGSWWAYRELGWGGWWFWDPVENASLLPWLAATALIHSLIVTEKRGVFQGWTLLLAIITFTLSLLSTFLVRSSVLVSVHAFANDPSRGIYLLSYLAIVISSAFLLYAGRIKYFYRAPHFNLLSRETFLLINSVVLLAAVATIMLGTLYPIIIDALNYGKISVGEPYFNTVFLPIIIPALLLMGAAPHVQWQTQSIMKLIKKLYFSVLLSILITLLSLWMAELTFHFFAALGIFIATWIILSTLFYAYKLWQNQHTIALKHASMIIAHIGIAILVLGITINKSYSDERQVKIFPGDTTTLAGYEFTLNNFEETKSVNFESTSAVFLVKKNKQLIDILVAEQRNYISNNNILSKPGVLFNPWRDLYLVLGNALPDGAWAIRIYYKPFVRWIWFGGFMLLISGFLSLISHWKQRKIPYESI